MGESLLTAGRCAGGSMVSQLAGMGYLAIEQLRRAAPPSPSLGGQHGSDQPDSTSPQAAARARESQAQGASLQDALPVPKTPPQQADSRTGSEATPGPPAGTDDAPHGATPLAAASRQPATEADSCPTPVPAGSRSGSSSQQAQAEVAPVSTMPAPTAASPAAEETHSAAPGPAPAPRSVPQPSAPQVGAINAAGSSAPGPGAAAAGVPSWAQLRAKLSALAQSAVSSGTPGQDPDAAGAPKPQVPSWGDLRARLSAYLPPAGPPEAAQHDQPPGQQAEERMAEWRQTLAGHHGPNGWVSPWPDEGSRFQATLSMLTSWSAGPSA